MTSNSKDDLTQRSWDPVTGCTRVSPGCARCRSARDAARPKEIGPSDYDYGFQVTCHDDAVFLPLRWKTPRRIIVGTNSDLFHEHVAFDFLWRIFEVMNGAHWHRFHVLTKRSQRLVDVSAHLGWPENVWVGVSVENADHLHRVEHLRKCGAKHRFLVLEPLLGPLPNLELDGIEWVAVGGERGRHARPMIKDWVIDIRDQCQEAGIPFRLLRWHNVNDAESSELLDAHVHREMPSAARPETTFSRQSVGGR